MKPEPPRLLFAEIADLNRLQTEAELPDSFLVVSQVALEDTPLRDFRESLKKHAVVALPTRLFSGFIDEPLRKENIEKYRTDLRERVKGCIPIFLRIVSGADSVTKLEKELLDFHDQVRPKQGTTTPRAYILVLTCKLTPELGVLIQKIKDTLQAPVYLMTETLEAGNGTVVRAEFVWPLAVADLLIRLAYSKVEPGASLLAWHSISYGPKPNDEEVEDLRRKFSEEILLPASVHKPEEERFPNPSPQEFFEDTENEALRRNPNRNLEEITAGQNLREWMLDALREKDGVGCLDQSSSETENVKHQRGWEHDTHLFGERLAKARRDYLNSSVDDGLISSQLQKIFLEVQKDPKNIRKYAQESIPATISTPSAPEQIPDSHRKSLCDLEKSRIKSRNRNVGAVLGAEERDKAYDRFLGPLQRSLFATIAVMSSIISYSMLAKTLADNEIRFFIIGVFVLFSALVGAAVGIFVPWLQERALLENAAKMLHLEHAQAREERLSIGKIDSRAVVDLGESSRLLNSNTIALQTARRLCKRIIFIIEKAIENAKVPSIQDRENKTQGESDELENLSASDRDEFRIGSHKDYLDESFKKDDSQNTMLDRVRIKLKGNNSIKSIAIRVRPEKSDRTSITNLAIERMIHAQDWTSAWNQICNELDSKWRGHFPYERLFPIALNYAVRIRISIWKELAEEKFNQFDDASKKKLVEELQVFFGKRVSLLTSCEIKGEEKSSRGYVLHRADLKDSKDNPLQGLAQEIEKLKPSETTQVNSCPDLLGLGMVVREYRIIIDSNLAAIKPELSQPPATEKSGSSS